MTSRRRRERGRSRALGAPVLTCDGVAVVTTDEVRQDEEQTAQRHQQHTGSHVARLTAALDEEADEEQEGEGAEVVTAGNEARPGAAQLVASFQGNDDDVDNAVDDEALEEVEEAMEHDVRADVVQALQSSEGS